MSMSGIGATTNPQVFNYGNPGTAGAEGAGAPAGPGLGAAAGGGAADVPQGGGPGSGDAARTMTSPGKLPSSDSEARISALVKQIEQQSESTGPDALVRAMIDNAGAQRKEAVTARMQARQAATGELMGEAGSMQDEAKNMTKAAITSLIVGVVASAASVVGTLGGAIRSIKNAGKELEQKGALIGKDMAKIERKMKDSPEALQHLKQVRKEWKEGSLNQAEHLGMGKHYGKLSSKEIGYVKRFEDLHHEMAPITAAMKKEQKINVAFDSLKNASDLAQKSSEGGKGLLDASNKQMEADQKSAEARQQVDGGQEDIQQTVATNVNEMIQKILEFVHDVQEAKSEGMQAATRA